MSRKETPPETTPAKSSPLSLDRLRAAFAQMLGDNPREPAGTMPDDARESVPASPLPGPDPCEISPRSVVEAMLFVGRPEGRAFSARELAAAMRGVSPSEIEAAVAELNQGYERDAAPYEIAGSADGYRLEVRQDFHRMRDKFFGRIRETRLSPAAMEVLAIVAYSQPTTAAAIDDLRRAPSGAALAWLVRRQLVRVERLPDEPRVPRYATTDRFLRLFGLESVAALPRSEELEKI